jgi:putative addiction module component (TIGR02574 family)
MDFSSTLTEIASLSIDDRLKLVHAILDTVANDQSPPELTEEQKEELRRRVAELDADPNNVLTWDEIKARVRAKK